MPTLYLVRHGQTEYNAKHIVQGHCDSPLTPLGVKQVEETAAQLADIPFTTCYHSPLGRTVRTTDILLKGRTVPRIANPGLKEINLGILEEKEFTNPKYAKEFEFFWKHPTRYTGESTNGESYDALEERIYTNCQEIAQAHKDAESILIVSHGAAIRSFLNKLTHRPREQFWNDPDITPASVSIVEWNRNNTPKVLSYAGNKL